MKHWLRALRDDLEISQEEMGRQVGVSKGRISQIEKSGGTLANERVLEVWKRHQRRLRRLNFTLDDLLTARPQGEAAA